MLTKFREYGCSTSPGFTIDILFGWCLFLRSKGEQPVSTGLILVSRRCILCTNYRTDRDLRSATSVFSSLGAGLGCESVRLNIWPRHAIYMYVLPVHPVCAESPIPLHAAFRQFPGASASLLPLPPAYAVPRVLV
uniref:Putative translation initiation factor 5b eif-5b n=1 Tax=Ixodes ricinus TaxID=34613 RepID=A0A0K8RIU9_IXORI